MTEAEKRVIAAAIDVVNKWVDAKRNATLMLDADKTLVTSKQALAGIVVSRMDYDMSRAQAVAAELDLIHDVDQLEKERLRIKQAPLLAPGLLTEP